MSSRYAYDPSLAVATVVAVLFAGVFIGTALQTLRYKSWVWLFMVLGVAMEAGGYIARAASTKDVTNGNLYVVQFLLVFLAPVFMAAACYIVFGRIVFHIIPRESRTVRLLWIWPGFITPIFVTSDIISLLLQTVGAALFTTVDSTDADAASKISKGKEIAQIGVAIQLAFFGLFTFLAIRFNFIARRFDAEFEARLTQADEKYATIDGSERKLIRNWPALLRVTNVACGLILIRSIYRMVEFSLGRDGYTETHEWTQYVFDALPVFVVVALFAWWHPGKYLPYMGMRKPKHTR